MNVLILKKQLVLFFIGLCSNLSNIINGNNRHREVLTVLINCWINGKQEKGLVWLSLSRIGNIKRYNA